MGRPASSAPDQTPAHCIILLPFQPPSSPTCSSALVLKMKPPTDLPRPPTEHQSLSTSSPLSPTSSPLRPTVPRPLLPCPTRSPTPMVPLLPTPSPTPLPCRPTVPPLASKLQLRRDFVRPSRTICSVFPISSLETV